MLALSYLFLVAPYFIAIILALLLVALLVQSTQSPWGVMSLLGLAMVAETASIYPLAFNLGLWIYPGDAFAGVTAAALLCRVLFMGKRRLVPTAWWVFGAAQFVLFVWGLAAHGTGAGVDYRSHFSAWVGAAYLSTFVQDEGFIKKLLVLVQIIAVSVMVVAVYRWVGGALDPAFGREIDFFITTGVPYRVIWVAPTFMISVAMLVAIFYATSRSFQPAYWFVAIVFGLVVLVLQHRTVWVTSMAGVGALAFALSKARAGAGLKMAAAALGLLVLVGVAATSLQGVSDSIQSQAERAVSGGGTFAGGRVTSWAALLKEWASSGSPTTYLLGKPFGSGYERFTSAYAREAVTYMPHNYYVQLLYRGGLVGLLAFLWTMGQAAAALQRQLAEGQRFAPMLLALFAAVMLYYVPYGFSYDHAIFLGLLLGAIARDRAIRALPLPASVLPARERFATVKGPE